MNINQLKAVASRANGFAMANQFMVTLPSLGGRYDTNDLNVLCSNVNMPGRQILTQERLIGIKGRKMPNGFASDDVNLTFNVMNDYRIKQYFEDWQESTISQNTHEIKYAKDYCRDVRIAQLRKGKAFDFPIDRFFGINIDIDLRTDDAVVYEVLLMDAFPTTMNGIELSNELDGLVQLSVQLSYRNWKKVTNRKTVKNNNPKPPNTSLRPRARPAKSPVRGPAGQ